MPKKGIADRIRDRYSIQQVMDMVGVAVDWNATLAVTSYVWLHNLEIAEIEYGFKNSGVEELEDEGDWHV